MSDTSINKGQQLFFHLLGLVIEEKINSFSELKKYLAKAAPYALTDKRYYVMIKKVFAFIRRLNWGFFAGLCKENHERLWKELVVEDDIWQEAGDLKKTITLSDLYIAMLDIHGYTKFCNDNKMRLDKLHLLDQTIINEVQDIAGACRSICKRERGDEILVISALATDCILAAISIIDFFAGTKSLPCSKINTERKGNARILPGFKISAGIAGGQTPLIITETGNISGPLLNTAARLQARANELSPRESKIMTTKQIEILMQKELKKGMNLVLGRNAIHFFDTGRIQFKGVVLTSCEIIFKDDDKYKSGFLAELQQLENALHQGLWESSIFTNLIKLILRVVMLMPQFSIEQIDLHSGKKNRGVSNELIGYECHICLEAFEHKTNYPRAFKLLEDIIKKLELVPEFDRLTLDYAHQIYENYMIVLKHYEIVLDNLIEEQKADIFNENDLAVYSALRKNIGMYEKLKKIAQESPHLKQCKAYWFAITKKHKPEMPDFIYSGKK